MRKIVLSAVVATVAALSFAAPSKAGDISIGIGFGGGWSHGHHGHSWGHGSRVTFYGDDDYGYDCFWKKKKRYDKWGNVVIKKVRICR